MTKTKIAKKACNPDSMCYNRLIKRKGNTKMKNTALLYSMIGRYDEKAYTHNYIFGFYFKGNVYMVVADSNILGSILKLDMASRGQGYSLRFCPNTDQKLMLLAMGATVLCSTEFFNMEVLSSRYNKGEIFEKMVTEYYGQEWTKDSVPFTEDGDLTVNHIAYQIKFEKATFTNEKSLARL